MSSMVQMGRAVYNILEENLVSLTDHIDNPVHFFHKTQALLVTGTRLISETDEKHNHSDM